MCVCVWIEMWWWTCKEGWVEPSWGFLSLSFGGFLLQTFFGFGYYYNIQLLNFHPFLFSMWVWVELWWWNCKKGWVKPLWGFFFLTVLLRFLVIGLLLDCCGYETGICCYGKIVSVCHWLIRFCRLKFSTTVYSYLHTWMLKRKVRLMILRNALKGGAGYLFPSITDFYGLILMEDTLEQCVWYTF